MTTSPQESSSGLDDTAQSDGRSGESAPDAEVQEFEEDTTRSDEFWA